MFSKLPVYTSIYINRKWKEKREGKPNLKWNFKNNQKEIIIEVGVIGDRVQFIHIVHFYGCF